MLTNCPTRRQKNVAPQIPPRRTVIGTELNDNHLPQLAPLDARLTDASEMTAAAMSQARKSEACLRCGYSRAWATVVGYRRGLRPAGE